MRIDPLDDFAVQLQHEAQHAVRGRVLRAEVDRVMGDIGFGAAGAGDLFFVGHGWGSGRHFLMSSAFSGVGAPGCFGRRGLFVAGQAYIRRLPRG
jgi:hypothetical protein